MDKQQPYTCPRCGGPIWKRIEHSDIDPETGRSISSTTTYECAASCRGTIGADEIARQVRRIRSQRARTTRSDPPPKNGDGPTAAQMKALRWAKTSLYTGEWDYNKRSLEVCIRRGWLRRDGTEFTGEARVWLTAEGRAIADKGVTIS